MPASIFRPLGKREVLQTQGSAQNVIDVHNENEFLAALTALPNADSYCYGKSINIVSDIIATQQVTLGTQHSGLTIGTVSGARISTSSTLTSWLLLSLNTKNVTIRGLVFTANFAAINVFEVRGTTHTIEGNTVNELATVTNFIYIQLLASPIYVINNKIDGLTTTSILLLGGIGSLGGSLITGNVRFGGDMILMTANQTVFNNNVSIGGINVTFMSNATISNNVMNGAITISGGSSTRTVISGNAMRGFAITTSASAGAHTIFGNTNCGTITPDTTDAVGLNT